MLRVQILFGCFKTFWQKVLSFDAMGGKGNEGGGEAKTQIRCMQLFLSAKNMPPGTQTVEQFFVLRKQTVISYSLIPRNVASARRALLCMKWKSVLWTVLSFPNFAFPIHSLLPIIPQPSSLFFCFFRKGFSNSISRTRRLACVCILSIKSTQPAHRWIDLMRNLQEKHS